MNHLWKAQLICSTVEPILKICHQKTKANKVSIPYTKQHKNKLIDNANNVGNCF